MNSGEPLRTTTIVSETRPETGSPEEGHSWVLWTQVHLRGSERQRTRVWWTYESKFHLILGTNRCLRRKKHSVCSQTKLENPTLVRRCGWGIRCGCGRGMWWVNVSVSADFASCAEHSAPLLTIKDSEWSSFVTMVRNISISSKTMSWERLRLKPPTRCRGHVSKRNCTSETETRKRLDSVKL